MIRRRVAKDGSVKYCAYFGCAYLIALSSFAVFAVVLAGYAAVGLAKSWGWL